MKRLIIIGTILLLSIGNISAAYTTASGYSFDGNGLPEYPNEGVLWATIDGDYQVSTQEFSYSSLYDADSNTMYFYAAGRGYGTRAEGTVTMVFTSRYDTVPHSIFDVQPTFATYYEIDGDVQSSSSANVLRAGSGLKIFNSFVATTGHVSTSMFVSPYPITEYTLTGATCGINNVSLYMKSGSDYVWIDYDEVSGVDSYSFVIASNVTYKVSFDDGYDESFKCDGNEVIDRDICSYYTLNFLDNCANLLINPTISIFRDTDELIYYGNDNPVSLMVGTDVEVSDFLDIIIWTCDGNVMYSDYVEIIEKDMYHPDISWFLNVHVVDDNTGADISQAKVTRTQDCCIVGNPSGYALTQANGRVEFIGLSNSNIGLIAEKSGYNTYSKTINIGSRFDCQSEGTVTTILMNATTGNSTEEFNNGTHNDSEDVNGEGGTILPDDNAYGCGVYFKNMNGKIVDTINDTDDYVDMYYWVKGGNATLEFQNQIYVHWYTCVEYEVINNTYEYRRILNSNFSDYTDSYRGYIYNTTSECNDIQNLNVINQTYEEETHYENLTSHCHFRHKLSGNQIDYRSDIEIKIYANSTNSTLLNITAYLMNGTDMVDSKVLNWADFVGGSPKWWYVWNPNYEYTTGYNYTCNITGFDGYQLDTDEVWTSDITGNELTVFVKDNYNQQIDYATIFIEDWGSIATGSSNHAPVTGLSDGDYQYKATKSGYITSGWATITLNEHESVTCVLVALEETSVIGQKMSDKDIKSIFIPLMYILFIFMILGAFKYANE